MGIIPSPRPKLRVRLPVARPPSDVGAPSFTVDGPLRGRTVGLRHEGSWRSWITIVEEWQRYLRDDGAEPSVLLAKGRVGDEGERTRKDVAAWAESVDCGVSGLGTCGSCTSNSVSDAVALERLRRPAVAAVCSEFETHARNMASYLGHPSLKILVLPYPLEARPTDELRGIAAEYYPRFVELLGATR
ncbi:UGSC family (seleno)protein [Streptodolium elevatio]|uniref:UGSC-like domain-containing protein n=1 Tax=Streptodolium elevatio TaxID=3157996 RepID=A0ABV3D957_9ACTN